MPTLNPDDYKIADISLAGFGRKEIQLAEHEMPGLMATRAEFADAQPLAGAKIMGSLHMADMADIDPGPTPITERYAR